MGAVKQDLGAAKLSRSLTPWRARVVAYGSEQGLEWWKSEQICRWEMLRRSAQAEFDASGGVTFRTASPLREATLLLLRTSARPRAVLVNGQPAKSAPWNWHGFEFDAVTADLPGEVSCCVEG
jgi:hypothetical protein